MASTMDSSTVWAERRGPFPRLGQPIALAGLTVPNRTVMAAMSSCLGTEEGRVTDAVVEYYRRRAVGGTGLIVVEFTGVDRRFGRAETTQLLIDDDAAIAGHRRIAGAITAEGARVALQLHSPGQFAPRTTLDGLPYSPSAQVSRRDGTTPVSRELTAAEIEELVASFAAAATRAVAAGYEAIEIHGAHGYLPMAFLSPLTNRRDDAWGGDFDRRLRFPAEVLRVVKAAIGPARPLVYRLSSDEFLKGGLGLDDVLRIVPHLVAAGADAIHVSSGSILSIDRTIDPMSVEEGWRFAHSAAIRKAAGVPVIAVGPARQPHVAEAALARGDIDMIALGRPLLADPDWPRKAIAGDVDAIRPCTNCNWCFDQVVRHHGTIGCAENPATGHEAEALQLAGGDGRTAIVIGGGPGGMTAALDLAEAGFRTRLYEARDRLGGGLIASAAPPHKEKLGWYLRHLIDRLGRSPVDLRLNATPAAAEIAAEQPALVLLATGARATTAAFAGADDAAVVSAYAMLTGDTAVPEPGAAPTMVYGGGETGCEAAEFLAARGHRVILVTRSPAKLLARSAEPMYRKHLIARLGANPSVEIRDECTVERVEGGTVTMTRGDAQQVVQVAHVVVAQGRETGSPLEATLRAAGIRVALVGDVERIGRIGDAVHDARREVLRALQELAPS
jgi:2,4-dienoyl-CoA reductase-like NADH-dependent reductase (Old Yellow Enzyme family)